ncbi:hypothetical protein GCM10027446_12710 [Angustibacter peucedani]
MLLRTLITEVTDPSDLGFDPSGDSGFGDTGLGAFGAFGVVFVVLFVVVVGVVLYRLVQGGMQWQANNESPLATVPATVVTKRQETGGGGHDTRVVTRYYATFQLASGERLELPLDGREFGLLAEADHGQLTHQGTRFKGFERSGAPSAVQDSPQD